MRSLVLLLMLLFVSCSYDDGGSSGGTGKIIDFNYECSANTVSCIGADDAERRSFHQTIEIKCTWDCAINNTGYVDEIPQKKSDPAQHVFTFHKKGDNCWEVYDVATWKCASDQDRNSFGPLSYY